MIYDEPRSINGMEFRLRSPDKSPQEILEDLENEVLEDLAWEGEDVTRSNIRSRLNTRFKNWINR